MSVDDVIGSVIELCEELGISNNTYFFYSSDHGLDLNKHELPHIYLFVAARFPAWRVEYLDGQETCNADRLSIRPSDQVGTGV